jgi:hypothetical protein
MPYAQKTYDQNICDEYIVSLSILSSLKTSRKKTIKALLYLQDVDLYPLFRPLEQVKKALQRKIDSYDSRIAKANKEFIKANKAYKQYCANKEQS